MPRRAVRIVGGRHGTEQDGRDRRRDRARAATHGSTELVDRMPPTATLLIEHLDQLYTVAGPAPRAGRAQGDIAPIADGAVACDGATDRRGRARRRTCARRVTIGRRHARHRRPRPIARARVRRRAHARRVRRRSARRAAAPAGRRDVRGDRGGRRRHPVDRPRDARGVRGRAGRGDAARGSARCSRPARRRARPRAATASTSRPSCGCCASSARSTRCSRWSSCRRSWARTRCRRSIRGRQADFVRLVIDEMIPRPRRSPSGATCSAIAGFFTPEESLAILEAGRARGPEAAHSRRRAGRRAAASAVAARRRRAIGRSSRARAAGRHRGAGRAPAWSRRCCRARPSILKLGRFAPARDLIAAGVPVALATDVNPGGGFSPSMPFAMTLACFGMGLTFEEALVAATINGAASLDRARSARQPRAGQAVRRRAHRRPRRQSAPRQRAADLPRCSRRARSSRR